MASATGRKTLALKDAQQVELTNFAKLVAIFLGVYIAGTILVTMLEPVGAVTAAVIGLGAAIVAYIFIFKWAKREYGYSFWMSLLALVLARIAYAIVAWAVPGLG